MMRPTPLEVANSHALRWLRAADRALVRVLVWLIHGYQRWLSPWLGRQCRFHPTCSCYAEQALCQHGSLGGLRLTLWRLLRCQPFAKGGFDAVPERPPPRPPVNESDLHVTH